MIDVAPLTGRFTPARGRAWTESISALDAAGNKPSTALTIMYSMYWRMLNGKIYASSVPIIANECAIAVPTSYMNPQAVRVYLDVFWVCSDGTVQKYGSFTVDVQDEPDTSASSGAALSAPYPVIFMSSGMPVEDAWLGSMQWKCPTGGGTLTLLCAGAGKASVGGGIQLALCEAGAETGDTITIAEGATYAEDVVSITVTGGSVYRFKVLTVGTDYAGEDVYAYVQFVPSS